MSLFEPFTWLLTGLLVAMGYAYLSVPRVERPQRCLAWGIAFGFGGGLAGYALAMGLGAANPPAVAIALSAMAAAAAMGAIALLRGRYRHQ